MNIHFIGIGGISMSALAEICINKKYNVSAKALICMVESLQRN